MEEKDIAIEDTLQNSTGLSDDVKKEKSIKKTTVRYAIYNGNKKEILEQTKDKCLIEVETINTSGIREVRKQWFYKNALKIV